MCVLLGGNVLAHTNTLTRVKLLSEISQSPYCMEYNRLKLGSVNFQDSKKGAWRTTTLNLAYAVCSRYVYANTCHQFFTLAPQIVALL